MVMVDNMGNVSDLGRPSTFTKNLMVNIVLWLGQLKNVFKVRWKFAKHYDLDHRPRELPSFKALEELKEIVDDFCESLDPDEIRRAVANVRKRAAACIECGGGHFEHLLKKARKDAAEE